MKTQTTNRPQKFTTGHRKENKCYFQAFIAQAVIENKIMTLAELRIYSGDGAKVTACFWANHDSRSGSGWASGYGYCKLSSAAHEAIVNAGIDLSEPIGGRGVSAIYDAMEAIARMYAGENAIINVIRTHQ